MKEDEVQRTTNNYTDTLRDLRAAWREEIVQNGPASKQPKFEARLTHLRETRRELIQQHPEMEARIGSINLDSKFIHASVSESAARQRDVAQILQAQSRDRFIASIEHVVPDGLVARNANEAIGSGNSPSQLAATAKEAITRTSARVEAEWSKAERTPSRSVSHQEQFPAALERLNVVRSELLKAHPDWERQLPAPINVQEVLQRVTEQNRKLQQTHAMAIGF